MILLLIIFGYAQSISDDASDESTSSVLSTRAEI